MRRERIALCKLGSSYVMSDKIKALEFETPEAGTINFTPEEVEENVKDVVLSAVQFFNVEMSLRNTMTGAVGECMQLIEMLGLPSKQEDALKGNIKKVIWSRVQKFIDGQSELSGVLPQYKKCRFGHDGREAVCSECPRIE